MHVLASLQEVQVKTDRVVFSVPQLVRFFHVVSQDTTTYLLGKEVGCVEDDSIRTTTSFSLRDLQILF
jgi:hypothetical protein